MKEEAPKSVCSGSDGVFSSEIHAANIECVIHAKKEEPKARIRTRHPRLSKPNKSVDSSCSGVAFFFFASEHPGFDLRPCRCVDQPQGVLGGTLSKLLGPEHDEIRSKRR